MFSLNGLIPCALCPRNTFSGPSNVDGGSRECEPCPDNTFTANLGATGPSQCKKPCKSGYFSATGLEPCSPCPINFYQPNPGQQKCSECPKDSITHELGRSLEIECKALDCTGVKCQNRGTCAVENHQVVCQCKPGYRGKFCGWFETFSDSKKNSFQKRPFLSVTIIRVKITEHASCLWGALDAFVLKVTNILHLIAYACLFVCFKTILDLVVNLARTSKLE